MQGNVCTNKSVLTENTFLHGMVSFWLLPRTNNFRPRYTIILHYHVTAWIHSNYPRIRKSRCISWIIRTCGATQWNRARTGKRKVAPHSGLERGTSEPQGLWTWGWMGRWTDDWIHDLINWWSNTMKTEYINTIQPNYNRMVSIINTTEIGQTRPQQERKLDTLWPVITDL